MFYPSIDRNHETLGLAVVFFSHRALLQLQFSNPSSVLSKAFTKCFAYLMCAHPIPITLKEDPSSMILLNFGLGGVMVAHYVALLDSMGLRVI